MKKLITCLCSIALTACMLFSFAACQPAEFSGNYQEATTENVTEFVEKFAAAKNEDPLADIMNGFQLKIDDTKINFSASIMNLPINLSAEASGNMKAGTRDNVFYMSEESFASYTLQIGENSNKTEVKSFGFIDGTKLFSRTEGKEDGKEIEPIEDTTAFDTSRLNSIIETIVDEFNGIIKSLPNMTAEQLKGISISTDNGYKLKAKLEVAKNYLPDGVTGNFGGEVTFSFTEAGAFAGVMFNSDIDLTISADASTELMSDIAFLVAPTDADMAGTISAIKVSKLTLKTNITLIGFDGNISCPNALKTYYNNNKA